MTTAGIEKSGLDGISSPDPKLRLRLRRGDIRCYRICEPIEITVSAGMAGYPAARITPAECPRPVERASCRWKCYDLEYR
jgi:hypothetical protein